MPNELKPCPFCGNMPYQHPETKRIWCDTYGCIGTAILAINTNEWNTRPIEDTLQARIADLKETLDNRKYSDAHHRNKCKEPQARIEELDAALDKAAHQLYDYSGSCPSDLYDWEHPNTCIRECDRYDNPDEAWKCWRLWLLEKPKGGE